MSGSIYAIRNLVTGDIYIGATRKPIKYRREEHERGLRLGNHPNAALRAACSTYGAASFVIEVLESVAHSRDLQERENYWLAATSAAGVTLYNIQPISHCSVAVCDYDYR